MITDSFDDNSEAIITPGAFYGERKKLCDIAIGTFSREIFETVLEKYHNSVIAEIRAANRIRQIFLVTADDLRFAFYLSEIGSMAASTDLIEVNWRTGAEHFILFGSAGALDNDTTTGRYVIPTEAYRDEGMSYHYAPPADYIGIKNSEYLAEIFGEASLPYVAGRVWTTDALYRETRDLVARRKAEGCIAVEMELAGMQAVSDYYGYQLYDFLVTGDVVDQPDYAPDGLHEANHSQGKFDIALFIAAKITENLKR